MQATDVGMRSSGGQRTAVILLLTVILTVWGLLAPTTAAAQSAVCSADRSTACLGGTIQTSARQPAPDVALAVDGPTGLLEATTDANGTWSIALAEAGEYTVTLDTSTLPAGETLRDPSANPRTVTVVLGRSSTALFALGDPVATGTPTSGGSETTDSGTTGGTVTDETGAVAESSGGSGTNRYAQLVMSGLIFGILLALASLGANLIYGTTGLSNFAHGELVTLGGMTAFMAVQWWGLPLWLAIVISTILGGVMGWMLNAFIFAPLRKRRVGITQQMIVTIGLALAGLNAFLFVFGAQPAPIVSAISSRIQIGPVQISAQSLTSLAIALVVLAAVALTLSGTRLGRATRAVSDNPALAAATGIKVETIISGVWVVSAALASLGGVLLALYLNSTRFNFGSTLLLLMFAAITLGGLGSPAGAVVGAVVIGLVVEMSTLILPNDMRYASALVILILVLLFRPQGILGRAERVG